MAANPVEPVHERGCRVMRGPGRGIRAARPRPGEFWASSGNARDSIGGKIAVFGPSGG